MAACMAGGIDAESERRTFVARGWEKFVFLVGLSATTTTMRGAGRPDPVEDPQSRAFLLDLMREVVAVGRARGCRYRRTTPSGGCEFADGVSPEMTSSMRPERLSAVTRSRFVGYPAASCGTGEGGRRGHAIEPSGRRRPLCMPTGGSITEPATPAAWAPRRRPAGTHRDAPDPAGYVEVEFPARDPRA